MSRQPAPKPLLGEKKKKAFFWSSVEILDLIEVWGEEANLQDLCTKCRNVDIYGWMADILGQKGHMRTQGQVRKKVKELRQAHTKARKRSAQGQHPIPAPILTSSTRAWEWCQSPTSLLPGLETPVVSFPESVAEEEVQEEKKEDEEASTNTMPASQKVIQALEPVSPGPGYCPGIRQIWGRPISWTSCEWGASYISCTCLLTA
nr:uncharacterized protein LOC112545371 [Pelodiscus sinensis]|eukprot:XP_025039107.1 uncharacterized protein LOC112545371 [Pelodiscus sinensis]